MFPQFLKTGTDQIYNTARTHYRQFLRYKVVGLGNTVLDFGVFALLVLLFDVPAILAHIVAFLVATLNSFVWNAFWTFKSLTRENYRRQAGAFFAVALSGLVMSSVLLWILSFYMPVLVAKILVIGVTVIYGYVVNSLFVFREKKG